jgi:hypothetical protein
MTYPSLEQYNQAFQAHTRLLTDPELQKGTVAVTGLGMPLALCGGFALTYTVKSGSKKYAVKCFHRESKALEKRYDAISDKLSQLKSPYFLDFQFQPRGIQVNGSAYPIVKMAWAQGETLGEFLENTHKDKTSISNLASSLVSMAAFFERENIAHGDLQNGNLMVSNGGRTLQLIDYDGMFVDAIKGLGSSELGQLNFQHPLRKSRNPFDSKLDRFPLILLSLALKALQEDATIWKKSSSEPEAIIFRANDFVDPASSQVFATLMSMPALAQDVKNFAAICKSPMENIPSLADFLARRNIPQIIIELRGKLATGQAKQGYLSAYDVLSADNYAACLNMVGSKVEIIGSILEVKENRDRNGKTYVFINFGNWRGKIFKISIWSEGLSAILNKPDQSWVGKWISVVGLMEPPYTSKKYKYSHLSITVATNGQINFISETEAKWRLAGSGTLPNASSSLNADALNRIKNGGSSQSASIKTNSTIPTPPHSGTPNQQALNKIRAAQGSTVSQPRPSISTHSRKTMNQYPVHKPPEKSVAQKILKWIFG